MKSFFLILFSISLFAHAQTYKRVKVYDGNKSYTLRNANIDFEKQELSYFDNAKQSDLSIPLSGIDKIKHKRGSYWLVGLLGGTGAGILISVATKPENGEWWYGSGPKILIGMGVGTLVGAFLPKESVVYVNDSKTLSLSLNGIQLKF